MSSDLTTLQKRINNIAKREANAPTAGSTEWNIYLEYLNRALSSWAEAYDWDQLYVDHRFQASGTSGATVSLPSDFKKAAGMPKITVSGTDPDDYTFVDPRKINQYNKNDRYAYILGNQKGGYNLIVNPASINSGTSLTIPYYKSPASLASPTDVSECPNDDYLVQKSLAYLFEATEDSRFPQAKVEADKILLRMLEKHNSPGEGLYDRVQTSEEARYSFRWGRD